MSKAGNDRFKNRKEAFLYFTANGGKISQSTFYAQVSPNQNGTVNRDVIDKMIEVEASRSPSPTTAAHISTREELEVRKLRAEVHIKELEETTKTREHDRKWLYRDQVEELIAGLIGTVVASIEHKLYRGTSDILASCGGDAKRVGELCEVIGGFVASGCNAVANRQRINGIFIRKDDEMYWHDNPTERDVLLSDEVLPKHGGQYA